MLSMVSLTKLETCDKRLINLVMAVAIDFPIAVTCGHRGEAEQNAAFNAVPQRSQTPWPESKHNSFPSLAVDICPVELVDGKQTIDWKDRERFCYLAGMMMREAKNRDIKLRWGLDWDSDTDLKETKLRDYPHFEVLD